MKVPVGEQWVIQSGGKYKKTISTGSHFLMPLVDSVKCVKQTGLCSLGVFAPKITLKDGKVVDCYAVAYYYVTNASKSAYFKDPESNKYDSERTAARAIKKSLSSALSNGASNTEIISQVMKTLGQKQQDWGLEFKNIELRILCLLGGVFDTAENVPAKIRAYDPPMPDFNTPGHDLKADYWSDHLSPPFFFKNTYGSSRRPQDSTVPSMEWSIPSPPDFHHFNMQPKVAVAPEEEELAKLGTAKH